MLTGEHMLPPLLSHVCPKD